MPSTSFSDTNTIVIVQGDVLFVANQINVDLQTIQLAYPDKVTIDEVMKLFTCYSSFMADYAVSQLGFCIYDPLDRNLVYCEYRYQVLYGGEVRNLNPDGRPIRMLHPLLQHSYVPLSARFTPWVSWSKHMLGLSRDEQARIVSGSGWSLPSQANHLDLKYDGLDWESLGLGGRGAIAVKGTRAIRK